MAEICQELSNIQNEQLYNKTALLSLFENAAEDQRIKLVQGDCMEVLRKMRDNSVDFTLTDIPYDEVNRTSNGLRNLDKGLADDKTFILAEFLGELYRVTKNSICIFCGTMQFSEITAFFKSKKGTTRPVVYEKTNPSPMNGQYIYLSGVELGVWYKKKGASVFNARCKKAVFKYPNGSSKYHPTQKNLGLFKELILDNTNENQIVFDPCMGSGTTGIACIESNRRFWGIELDGGYFGVARDRILGTQLDIS